MISASLVATVALSGCASSGSKIPATIPAQTQNDISNAIVKVQDAARKACAFLPTVQTVAGILQALGVRSVSEVTGVAAQICAAVTRQTARRGTRPSVAGVPIYGRMVR